MEQPTVDRGIKQFRQLIQAQGVHHQEVGFQAAFLGLLLRQSDGPLQVIDAGDLVPALGEEQRVITGAAADVED